jgi:hypothetical protein
LELKKLKYIILLCLSSSFLFGQAAGLSLLRNQEFFKIKFRSVQGFIVIDVKYGGLIPMSFIFDTGAQNTVFFDKKMAEILPVRYEKEVTLLGADMQSEIKAFIARNLIFQIGESPLVTKDVIILEEDKLAISESIGESVHGIIGSDFIRGLIVQIDYHNDEIVLYASNKINPKRFNNYVKVESKFQFGKILLNTGIINEKKDTVNLKLLLDTGAGISAMFHKNTNDQIKLPTNYINGNLGRGIGGDIIGIIGKVDQLTINNFSFYNLISYYQDIERTYYDSLQFTDRNGLLGNVVLNCFSVMIDYVKEEVYLKPNKRYKKEIKYDRSGILLIAQGPKLDKIIVHDILPNSPAAKAGLRKGDQITSITWHRLEQLSVNYLSRIFSGKVGKKIQVRIKRGGVQQKVELVLQNLL